MSALRLVRYPRRAEWTDLFARPSTANVQATVATILGEVRERGDAALREYTARFDAIELDDIFVSREELAAAEVEPPLRSAIETAIANIERFHGAQRRVDIEVETTPGVRCRRVTRAIERVGLYVPGGSAPLISTVLMLGLPARLAGCPSILLCTPPQADGSVHPAILYAARRIGIDAIARVGGAQAIAALAYGTASIAKVDKIFGPGNAYVNEAKKQVQQAGVAIDLPAGPSELAIVADATANPAFVAADVLAQLEHDATSQAIVLSADESLLARIDTEIQRQLSTLPRQKIIEAALEQSRRVLVRDLDEAIELVNAYAPEHLGLATSDGPKRAQTVRNAGTILIGNHAAEALGDYATGANHVLPTSGAARAYAGVSLESFQRAMTIQTVTAQGLRNLAPTVRDLARAEGLEAHRRAVDLRLHAFWEAK